MSGDAALIRHAIGSAMIGVVGQEMAGAAFDKMDHDLGMIREAEAWEAEHGGCECRTCQAVRQRDSRSMNGEPCFDARPEFIDRGPLKDAAQAFVAAIGWRNAEYLRRNLRLTLRESDAFKALDEALAAPAAEEQP